MSDTIEKEKSPPILILYTYHSDDPLNYHLPFFLFTEFPLPHIRKFTNLNRKHFVAYCSSNPVKEREEIFRLLRLKQEEGCH